MPHIVPGDDGRSVSSDGGCAGDPKGPSGTGDQKSHYWWALSLLFPGGLAHRAVF